ncbi:MAG: hypothetical protein HY790_07755 [Deltaproteobacteria bacterium]|nr:hypothetical protein [Deltaproteobacteria bacterium]
MYRLNFKKWLWLLLALALWPATAPAAEFSGQTFTRERLVGNERVLGYDAEKYEVAVSGRDGLERQTYWVAGKLGMPIKVEIPARKFSMEYRNIKEGRVADRLFEIPQGYQKVTTPALEP